MLFFFTDAFLTPLKTTLPYFRPVRNYQSIHIISHVSPYTEYESRFRTSFKGKGHSVQAIFIFDNHLNMHEYSATQNDPKRNDNQSRSCTFSASEKGKETGDTNYVSKNSCNGTKTNTHTTRNRNSTGSVLERELVFRDTLNVILAIADEIHSLPLISELSELCIIRMEVKVVQQCEGESVKSMMKLNIQALEEESLMRILNHNKYVVFVRSDHYLVLLRPHSKKCQFICIIKNSNNTRRLIC